MLFPAGRLFTIGQFAKLHEINKKTLMWYDEIGLLKPATVGENGYRYYTYQQSHILEIILLLRELNVPIPEIRRFLDDRSAGSLERLFSEQIESLDRTIRHLEVLQKSLEKRRQDMETLGRLDLSEIGVVTKAEPHAFGLVDISDAATLEERLDRASQGAKKYRLRRLFDASCGAMLPVERLYSGDFEAYTALYMELPRQLSAQAAHIQPAGEYLRAFCKGGGEPLAARCREILAYAAARGLTLRGHAYEKGINELVTDSLEEFIMQIEIPIAPRGKK